MRKDVIALAVTHGAPVFELAIPCEIFGRYRDELPQPWYEFRVCAADGPARQVSDGFAAIQADSLDHLAEAGTVIVPAVRDVAEEPSAELVAAIREAHRRGARIVSLCSGAFVLAAAGVLDGLRATTHWRYAAELARRYPAVTVDSGVLYIDEGDVLTSAGTTAGIDLCLHIVRRDHGNAVASLLAKRLVAPPNREGGQAQYIDTPPAPESTGLAPLLDWMREHLAEPLTIATLARQVSMAERTLIRRFEATTGLTPMRWLTAQRVLRARELLETSTLPVERVGEQAGLGSPANFRHHFTAAVGTSPSAYRRTFSSPAEEPPDQVGPSPVSVLVRREKI